MTIHLKWACVCHRKHKVSCLFTENTVDKEWQWQKVTPVILCWNNCRKLRLTQTVRSEKSLLLFWAVLPRPLTLTSCISKRSTSGRLESRDRRAPSVFTKSCTNAWDNSMYLVELPFVRGFMKWPLKPSDLFTSGLAPHVISFCW